jgi:hypothetical protein
MQNNIEPTASQGQMMYLEQKMKLTNTFNGGVGWFYWIAALSLVNTIIYLVGGEWSFFVGLGVTQLIDGFAIAFGEEFGGTVAIVLKLIAFALDLGIAGLFVVIGFFSKKRATWVIILGMILYAIDALIFLIVFDVLSIGFHAFALFGIFTGLRALNQLNSLEEAQPQTAITT